MKREKKLTKRERKTLDAANKPVHAGQHEHIHCIACGRHLEPEEFTSAPATAMNIRCKHGSVFPACTGCAPLAKTLVSDHDRFGHEVKRAQAWH